MYSVSLLLYSTIVLVSLYLYMYEFMKDIILL